MRMEDFAEPRTKGRRRELRSSIRNILGTSSDTAPDVYTTLLAANKLQRLLDLASGGRYGLAVVELGMIPDYRSRGIHVLPTKTISGTLGHVRRVQEENARTGSTRLPYDLSGTP